jgi:hypothetical protein
MTLSLFNDSLDDVPVSAGCDGFSGVDIASKANLLSPDIVRDGRNVWMDSNQLLQTRPGLRFNVLLNTGTAGLASPRIQGLGYYDTPLIERTLAVRAGKLYEINGADVSAPFNELTGPTPDPTANVRFMQLVDRMFYVDTVLRWAHYDSGPGWTHGTVTAFDTAAPMPDWLTICAHGFRMLAVESKGYKIYASAIGQAKDAADWVQTENIRVGTGEGDPITALISGQAGNLIVLNLGSAWVVDTTDPQLANWIVRKITDVAGCVEGKTAVSFGQDVIFLSRHGVVTLGALANIDSISSAQTLSAPVQPIIDRINWAAIGNAFATLWQDLYLLAVPLDNETHPSLILPFNMRTRRWMTPWAATLGGVILGDLGGASLFTDETGLFLEDEDGNLILDSGGSPADPLEAVPFEGFSAALVTRFAGRQETLIGDTTGRLLKIDPSYEKDDNGPADSQDVPSWVTLKAHDFDFPQHDKQPFWLEVEFRKSTANGVQLNLVRDGLLTYPEQSLDDCEIIARPLTTGTLGVFPIVFPLEFKPNANYRRTFHIRNQPRFRECGLQVHCPRGRLSLRSARFSVFLDTPNLIT